MPMFKSSRWRIIISAEFSFIPNQYGETDNKITILTPKVKILNLFVGEPSTLTGAAGGFCLEFFIRLIVLILPKYKPDFAYS